jgi:hypothetical protein
MRPTDAQHTTVTSSALVKKYHRSSRAFHGELVSFIAIGHYCYRHVHAIPCTSRKRTISGPTYRPPGETVWSSGLSMSLGVMVMSACYDMPTLLMNEDSVSTGQQLLTSPRHIRIPHSHSFPSLL